MLTGEEFETNRSNQNFIKAQNRVEYYNRKARDLRQRKAYIDKPLHKNHLLLEELMEDKNEAVFHKQFHLGKGLSFNIHTHYETYMGNYHRAIYQYIIVQMENEQIKIIKK